ncbi:uncharacterized protein LOC120275771 isoform X1 [Dioscorea cayenensis subsp. rotundata]|uniref:Uncharacterized protein LOC120275771 isoform X1 n=1 Tax=Dioscorea cayennensis subsp. rotundata TaxID=55577 RepID=A0AB40CG67_DIOCR|nr:uncharacterized protein LOC120275771 isoform X1 [Dioscorea cayenensis subsp. rotundata]
MDYALSMIKDFPVQGTNLVEEMKELGKLCSSINMNEQQQQQQQQHQQQQQPVVVVVCPKPRRLNFRSYGDYTDIKVAGDLSDILVSKATPPYFTGSPPVRSTNPVSRDALFLKYKAP